MTVYVVVAEGKAITVVPVLTDKSPAGLHEYVGLAPQFAVQLAVKVTLLPLQIVVEAGEMDTVGV